MNLFLQTSIPVFFFASAFAQEVPNVEVRPVEYVWERSAGDNRIVFVKDPLYQEILTSSFMKAIVAKWNEGVPSFEVKVNKMSSFTIRTEPKFNTSVPNPDTAKRYVFLQLFDRSLPVNAYNLLFSSRINVKYRLIKAGATLVDKTISYKVAQRIPAAGQIAIKRYPFHPSQFRYLCDTIASSILNDEVENEREIWLEPACAFTIETINPNLTTHNFKFGAARQSISITGGNAFTIVQDSVNHRQTGKKSRGAGNAVGGLLTLFSNIDTEKKKSRLYTADHTFNDGSTAYHAYVRYIHTKVADRRRVKDEQGFKSIEVGEYESGYKEINPDAEHIITLNDDTLSSFRISFFRSEERFSRMWDGRDANTVDSLPFAFNNAGRIEMQIKGTIGNNQFVLTTTDLGKIKKLSLNDNQVFSFYGNTGPEGVLTYIDLNERQFKIATLLCLLSEQYYSQYITL